MAHKKALAALTVAALSVTGAVVVPAPALAAYAKQGTDKHVEDVFWLDLAGVTGPDGRIIPGKEATVPGLEGYTVKVKVGDEQLPIATDKKAAAFDIDGVSTLVSTDKEATQKITVTLTKDGKPEPLTLVVPDLNGQKVKVTTSAEDWKGLALEVAPDRLGHKDFSTITRPDSSIVPLVRTENKENSTILTLELGAGEQKAMIGILKARPEAPAEDPIKAIGEAFRAIGNIDLPTSGSETPSSSSETSSASAEPTTTATSEKETAEPTPTSTASTTSATSEPTSTTETAASTAEASTSETSTEATSAESSEPTTITPAEPSTEEPTSSMPTEDVTKPANPNPKPDGNSGSASASGNGSNPKPDDQSGAIHPDPPKADGDSSSSSGAPDTDAVIGSVIGVLTVGGLGAGILGGAVDKVMTPVSPSTSKSNSNAKNQRPQQKKPKVTVKQPNGESLTLAEMKQRSNSKSAPTTKSASMGKPKVTTKAKSKTSKRQAQQKKPRISVGKKKSSTKAANSSKKKSSSKKKLADTGAPIGLPIGLASLLIMSGLVLLGVRQRRSQI